ncbi:MAG: ABC transporter permease, partial [Rhodothermales bacterium]|nr:ABC transporter permease [Rhodothermales bacterium]
MLNNYLTTALRALRRQRLFGFINVFGLAVGLACALLITLYVQHELAYDRHYPHADRLYRVTSALGMPDAKEQHFARAAYLVADVLRETDPDVEAAARLVNADPVVHVGEEVFIGERFFFTE